MGLKTLVISKHSKLELSLSSVVIRSVDGEKMISIDDLNLVIIESTSVDITAALLSELVAKKVRIIFCDEKHNPQFECMPYYGTQDTSLKVKKQIHWMEEAKKNVWKRIVEMKIQNQARVLCKAGADESYKMLLDYCDNVLPGDITNREGHAAKVYFNTLFGVSFSRKQDIPLNAKLNFGYALLLSMVGREIASLGYITQIGIHHDNQDNQFNLACDFMEPFRPVIDSIVINNFMDNNFDTDVKHALIDKIVTTKIIMDNKVFSLGYGVGLFVQSVIEAVEQNTALSIREFEYEY